MNKGKIPYVYIMNKTQYFGHCAFIFFSYYDTFKIYILYYLYI